MALRTWAARGKKDSAPTSPLALQGGDPKKGLTPGQGGRDPQGQLSPQGPGWWAAPSWDSPSRDLCLTGVPKVGKGTQAGGSRWVREAVLLCQVAPAARASSAQAAPARLGRTPACPPPHTASLPAVPQLSGETHVLKEAFFLCISKDPRFASQAEGGQGMPLSFSSKALIPTIARSSPVLLLSFPLPSSFEHLNLSLSKWRVFF